MADNSPPIRMVPYSPPRLESQLSQYSQSSQTSHNSQTSQPQSLQSNQSHSLSLSRQGRASPISSSLRSSPRHRRQRQRKRQSRELDGIFTNADDIEGGANDSDRTATTIASKRSKAKRPSSWGPAAAFAAAVSAVTGAASSSRSGSSPTSTTSSANPGSDGDNQRPGSVLSEKSRNVMFGGNWTNAKTEGYASIEIPLAGGSNKGVSGAKLASPTTTAATTTRSPNATSDTPPSNTRHSRYSSRNSKNKSSYIAGDYDATSSASSRLLAHHGQSQHQPEQPQPLSDSHNESSPTSLSSSLPRGRLGLPPASASFSAAAASYLTEHSNYISNIADTLVDAPYSLHSAPSSSPASPASAYSAYSASPDPSYVPSSYPINYSPSHQPSTFPPSLQSSLPSSYQPSGASLPSSSYLPHTITNTGASSYNLTSHSLSSSPSIGSLSSVSSSQATVPRPHSRRRNVIAIHPDKTFSLVPRGGAAQSPSQSQPPSAIPAVAASLKSTPLSLLSFSNSATSSTIHSSVSHERLFSGPYGSGDQSSSPLTTAASATLEDHSTLDSSHTPSPGSRSRSSTNPLDLDDRQPWNLRLVGGLRRDPKTPDNKRKGKARAYDIFASQTQTQSQSHFLPSLPEASSSSPTATIVTGPFAPEPTTLASSRAHEKKPSQSSTSSDLSVSASTLSANTNYKVYAHSSSPAAAHTTLQSLDSFADLDTHPGDTTNVEILGTSSPAAPPLPELQRNTDPNQSFASLNSYPSIASFDTGISYNESTLPNFVVIGKSSPPAPSRSLERNRSTTDSDAELDAGTDIDLDISSSPPLPSRIVNTTTDTLGTSSSDENYVLHGEPSSFFLPPSSSSGGSSLVTISKKPRQVYSRESLIVPPLKTVRAKRSNERVGYYKSRSRESLRRAASLKSLSSSIFNQEAASTFFAGQAFLSISIPPVPVLDLSKTSHLQQQLPAFLGKKALPKVKRKPLPLPAPPVQSENIIVHSLTRKKVTRGQLGDDSWESSSPPQLHSPSHSPSASQSTSPRPPSPTLPQQPKIRAQMVEEHPHQWSSQLSTVLSESEEDNTDIRLVSQSVSPMPGTPGTPGRAESFVRGHASIMSNLSIASAASYGGTSGLRSSAGWVSSSHSRNRPSISSSLALQLEEMRDRNSRDSSLLDRPGPAMLRGAPVSPLSPGNGGPFSPTVRTVRDLDEHGDGLADLHDMSAQPSRSGLSGFFTNSSNSVRNLHSSGSIRSLHSAGSGHFPSWARVYYGSGEHRALSGAPSVSDLGQGDDYMTGAIRPNSAFRRSPSVDDGPLNLFNTRRRPREVQPNGSEAVDMEAGDGGMLHGYPAQRPRGLRRITSSIWSPHLQRDRHAARFSVWDPPSVAWSDTSSRFDRRNMQVILFTIGFIMPITWMVASFLPLPLDPKRAMEKRMAEGEGEYGVAEALKQRTAQADENRFQSARWWRTLNRVMSLFGLLVLGAVIALVIIAVKQHWGQ